MYKLYLSKKLKMIDVSENEQDIIDTIGEYLKEDATNRFIIKDHNIENGDSITSINSYDDYIKYMEAYKQKLINMSCVELKKQIVKKIH